MSAFDKFLRQWQLAALKRWDAEAMIEAGARRVVKRFHEVARDVPAYADILKARGIEPERIRSLSDFSRHCPSLAKQDVFGTYPIDALCVGGRIGPLASVLTSSGQGGRFAFGISTPTQARRATKAIELAMEHIFATDTHRTLVLNALPMGVGFACSTVTLAETSVREDMVVALAEQFSPHYAQTILVTDPLFCKRILDHGRGAGLDWRRFKVHVILGEETFGEAFRRYVALGLGQDPDGWTKGLIMSSMGVAELGLNLFFETRETIRLRQLASETPQEVARIIGDWPGRVPPLLFVYNPLRTYVEVIEQDANGYGALVVSTLDRSLALPLLRYRTGDRAKLLGKSQMAVALGEAGLERYPLPALPMIAIAGRDADVLPDGRTLLDIKDALYQRPDVADALTGAFRLEPDESGCTLHVQTGHEWGGDEQGLCDALQACLPVPPSRPIDRIRLWPYDAFPFGRSLDYERKFSYLAKELRSEPEPSPGEAAL